MTGTDVVETSAKFCQLTFATDKGRVRPATSYWVCGGHFRKIAAHSRQDCCQRRFLSTSSYRFAAVATREVKLVGIMGAWHTDRINNQPLCWNCALRGEAAVTAADTGSLV